MKKLVIVESPSKAKTIEKFLGRGYKVTASMGHVMDLPKTKLGIDIENDFEPKYISMKDKKPLIKELTEMAKGADKVYLATDPDREGEAISWHLERAMKLPEGKAMRVTFNEITEKAVKAGIASPRKIDIDLVGAYQARRLLDRIVGYKISPLLWKSVRRGLSAGRVQSVAVRIVCLREREIKNFVPQEYWNLAVLVADADGETFRAKFFAPASAKEKQEVTSLEQAQAIEEAVKDAYFIADEVKKMPRHRHPYPPFTTSTLQQEASRRFGFGARRTMAVAQALYEGISLGEQGTTGLITYMRTDSLRLSDEAVAQAREMIGKNYGKEYLPESPRVYKTKASAQDAHEAIRPAHPELTPDMVAGFLTPEQNKLYRLIWERFTACQMADAVYDTLSVSLSSHKEGYESMIFRVAGSKKIFPGFTILYEDTKENDKSSSGEEEEKTTDLPNITPGEKFTYEDFDKQQKYTTPPPRYTEASLIRALEENGIGRPSTYAPTISTIQERNYVEKQARSLYPTELGEIVTELMEKHFPDVVDIEFTARLESELDTVSEGQEEWKQALRNFWGSFSGELSSAEKALEGVRMQPPEEVTDVPCEKCGRLMVIKSGRFGKFMACPGYPECKCTKPIQVRTQGFCPLCGGVMLERKSKKKGVRYYSCGNYPNCKFMSWDLPVAERCPRCGKTLFRKQSKLGSKFTCLGEGCGYELFVPAEDSRGEE